MEIIRIADSRHLAKQTPLPKEIRLDMCCLGYASQIRAVDAHRYQDGSGEEEGRDEGTRIAVVRPVGRVKAVGPRDVGVPGLRVIVVVLGGFPWWPSHCVDKEL